MTDREIQALIAKVEADIQAASTPAGTIIAFAGENIPAGYILCDGSILNAQDNNGRYKNLYEKIGGVWGQGNGQPYSFHLPNLQGLFLRGWEAVANNDPDGGTRIAQHPGGNDKNKVGSYQPDQFKDHNHNMRHFHTSGSNDGSELSTNPGLSNPATDTHQGGSETRPKNVYVKYVIKY